MFADDNNLFYINEYIKTLDTETLESKKNNNNNNQWFIPHKLSLNVTKAKCLFSHYVTLSSSEKKHK